MLMENVVIKDFPTMRVCPQCGINLARECVVCPQCGMDVSAVRSYPAAGSSLEQMKSENSRLYAQFQAEGRVRPAPQAAQAVQQDAYAAQSPEPAAPASPSAGGAAPARQANFCPQCGSRLIPGAKFCTSCGNRLS